jgi:hypothetical protein
MEPIIEFHFWNYFLKSTSGELIFDFSLLTHVWPNNLQQGFSRSICSRWTNNVENEKMKKRIATKGFVPKRPMHQKPIT